MEGAVVLTGRLYAIKEGVIQAKDNLIRPVP